MKSHRNDTLFGKITLLIKVMTKKGCYAHKMSLFVIKINEKSWKRYPFWKNHTFDQNPTICSRPQNLQRMHLEHGFDRFHTFDQSDNQKGLLC